MQETKQYCNKLLTGSVSACIADNTVMYSSRRLQSLFDDAQSRVYYQRTSSAQVHFQNALNITRGIFPHTSGSLICTKIHLSDFDKCTRALFVEYFLVSEPAHPVPLG
jgi:hypothetical protein